jgi:hypothetical protein
MLSRRAAIGYVTATVLLGFSQPALAARGASFQAIDSNGDGKVDLDEIKKAAAAKFDALDRNRTGTLTRREVGRLRLSRKDFAAADPEPPRVRRRPFDLSHAAMAGCSSMA